MPTDTPTDEREMAREALGLLWRLRPDDDERYSRLIPSLQAAGFWNRLTPKRWVYIRHGFEVATGEPAPEEPAAILAALRAVVGAADA